MEALKKLMCEGKVPLKVPLGPNSTYACLHRSNGVCVQCLSSNDLGMCDICNIVGPTNILRYHSACHLSYAPKDLKYGPANVCECGAKFYSVYGYYTFLYLHQPFIPADIPGVHHNIYDHVQKVTTHQCEHIISGEYCKVCVTPSPGCRGWSCLSCGECHIEDENISSHYPSSMYFCKLCPFSTNTPHQMHSHLWCTHVKTGAVCPVGRCSAEQISKYGSLSDADHHVRVAHPESYKWYQCLIPDKCQSNGKCRSAAEHISTFNLHNRIVMASVSTQTKQLVEICSLMNVDITDLFSSTLSNHDIDVIIQYRLQIARESQIQCMSTKTCPSALERIPVDVWGIIIGRLDEHTQFTLTKVSKHLRNIMYELVSREKQFCYNAQRLLNLPRFMAKTTAKKLLYITTTDVENVPAYSMRPEIEYLRIAFRRHKSWKNFVVRRNDRIANASKLSQNKADRINAKRKKIEDKLYQCYGIKFSDYEDSVNAMECIHFRLDPRRARGLDESDVEYVVNLTRIVVYLQTETNFRVHLRSLIAQYNHFNLSAYESEVSIMAARIAIHEVVNAKDVDVPDYIQHFMNGPYMYPYELEIALLLH